MAISNVSSYTGIYESLYASKQAKTSETDGTSATNLPVRQRKNILVI